MSEQSTCDFMFGQMICERSKGNEAYSGKWIHCREFLKYQRPIVVAQGTIPQSVGRACKGAARQTVAILTHTCQQATALRFLLWSCMDAESVRSAERQELMP